MAVSREAFNMVHAFSHSENLAEQQRRAQRLVEDRRCPHCREPISLLDGICMVRGHGYRFHVAILLPTGQKVYIAEREFNPQTMLWVHNADETAVSNRDSRADPTSRK
jgi:hypothetical protein